MSKLQTDLTESNEMLSMLMPWFVIERLNNFEISKNFVADDAGEIAILFCDIFYFDEVIKECQDKVVDLIDEIFRHFDQTCRQHGVQKIETVGKTYMACSGLKLTEALLTPEQRSQSATERALLAAEEMMELASGFTYAPGKSLQLKIGIHYGTCIFGVLGYHKPQFSLIGDTINTTSRHCTCGDPGNITLSEQAWAEVKKLNKYSATLKYLDMKGKGKNQPVYVISNEPEVSVEKKKRRKRKFAGTVINNNITRNKVDLKTTNKDREFKDQTFAETKTKQMDQMNILKSGRRKSSRNYSSKGIDSEPDISEEAVEVDISPMNAGKAKVSKFTGVVQSNREINQNPTTKLQMLDSMNSDISEHLEQNLSPLHKATLNKFTTQRFETLAESSARDSETVKFILRIG
jgi:class 3 adenylate cyclase